MLNSRRNSPRKFDSSRRSCGKVGRPSLSLSSGIRVSNVELEQYSAGRKRRMSCRVPLVCSCQVPANVSATQSASIRCSSPSKRGECARAFVRDVGKKLFIGAHFNTVIPRPCGYTGPPVSRRRVHTFEKLHKFPPRRISFPREAKRCKTKRGVVR